MAEPTRLRKILRISSERTHFTYSFRAKSEKRIKKKKKNKIVGKPSGISDYIRSIITQTFFILTLRRAYFARVSFSVSSHFYWFETEI